MEENKMCQVPRPIRAPKNLWGLTWKGLGLFAATSFFLGTVAWFAIEWIVDGFLVKLVAKGIAVFVIMGLCYQSFKVNEETGEMQVDFLLDRLEWGKLDHIITPEWEGRENVFADSADSKEKRN